ncbi:hypothetical protein BX286_0311 [Streptomyces sp. 3211.6]|uniref:DUF4190 domain-containing protein n=1 Tax=Streptomyces sp. 3211.6 TaxID=1938845 RepID=UPI000EAE581F|nr:DUF4190 domain-containing protein [Streptomyces sp. 3211.6]RKT02410.1 hypothetical protein BX286_0311 [Streptomyces sp. 3211.6]
MNTRTEDKRRARAEAAPHSRSRDRSQASARGAAPAPARARRDADAMAVTAFVLGLVGLLVTNLLLGPVAVVLGVVALRRRTRRPGRARLGIALGVADLVVLACLVTADGTWSWSLA